MVLRRLARLRRPLDFSDYLELRRLRDAGEPDPSLAEALATMEATLGIDFADRLPHLVTLEDAPLAPPRGLKREELRVVFAMRAEHVSAGATRERLMGFDLPEGEGLKDWLDFLEAERKATRSAREGLRLLDRKIWALMTGDRRMPTMPAASLLPQADAANGRMAQSL